MGELTTWLRERPKWLQVAAKRLLESKELDESAILELTKLCLQEAKDEFLDVDCRILSNAFDTQDSEEIRLCSLSEILGINKLAPRKPLDFGKSNIVIVYGSNGSGKSGYVRLLKHVCGARDSVLGPLHPNVFSAEEGPQKATISFLKNKIKKEFEWSAQGACDDLRSVDIFDTSFGRVFTGSGNEVSYEPPALLFFSELIDICERVGSHLEAAAGRLVSRMPSIPDNLLNSQGGNWLKKLSAKTSPSEVVKHCSFTAKEGQELLSIQQRVAEGSPADKACALRAKREHAHGLIAEIRICLEQLSDQSCKRIIDARKESSLRKSVAEAATKKIFTGAKLEGIGSDVWVELWNAAQKYSEEQAYKGRVFPQVQGDVVCVLCQQDLSDEARERFSSFKDYMEGKTKKESEEADREVQRKIDALPDISPPDMLKTKISAAGIEDQEVIKALNDIFAALRDRKGKMSSHDSEGALGNPIQPLTCINKIIKISQRYEDSAKQYEEDAKRNNHDALEKRRDDLQAKKWLHSQKAAVEQEIERLKRLDQIKQAKKKADTTALSKEKGKLSETYITDALVERFNGELRALNASRIKVKIAKTQVAKGRVLHVIRLDSAPDSIYSLSKVPLEEVLSEGEKRIVSIAAFLADVAGGGHPAPFIFDDPISSLDQDYEEAVVERLCSLASNRQVIIFTHRLSLLEGVQNCAESVGIEPEVICLREGPGGAVTRAIFRFPKRIQIRLSTNLLMSECQKLRRPSMNMVRNIMSVMLSFFVAILEFLRSV